MLVLSLCPQVVAAILRCSGALVAGLVTDLSSQASHSLQFVPLLPGQIKVGVLTLVRTCAAVVDMVEKTRHPLSLR